MNGWKNRIDKLENELRPDELIAMWLANFEQFDSPEDYIASALSEPQDCSPERQLLQQASVRRKKKRPLNPSDERQLIDWLKRMLFLKALYWSSNCDADEIVTNCRIRLESARQVSEILKFFSGSDAWTRSYQTESPSLAASDLEDPLAPTVELQDSPAGGEIFLAQAYEGLREILIGLRSVEVALGSISARFFRGRTIIFDCIARAMEDAHQEISTCAEELSTIGPNNLLCSEELESEAKETSEVLVDTLMDYAKTLALLRFDDKEKALETIQEHLDQESPDE